MVLSSPRAKGPKGLALGLLLADGALTVGRGRTFWRAGQVFFYENGHNSGAKSQKSFPTWETVSPWSTNLFTPIYFILWRDIKGSNNDCQDYTTFPMARDNPCGFNGRQQYNDGYVRDVLTRKKTAVLLNLSKWVHFWSIIRVSVLQNANIFWGRICIVYHNVYMVLLALNWLSNLEFWLGK